MFVQVVWQRSIHTKIRQPVLYIGIRKGYVEALIGDLTSAKDLKNTLCEIRRYGQSGARGHALRAACISWNVAHITQSQPESGLGFEVKVAKTI